MNMDCNLSCVYCYEGNMKGKHFMSGETAERLLAFISERLTPDKKLLNIDFYGGEPLLSLNLLKTIALKAGNLSRRRGVDFTFSLTTNGRTTTGTGPSGTGGEASRPSSGTSGMSVKGRRLP
jgi:uncharacterized protein